MPFFSQRKSVVIRNSKKMTESQPVLKYLKPKTVAIPLKYMQSEHFDRHVDIGDSVKIGTKLAAGKDNIILFSTVSGKVTAIEKRDHVSLKKADHIIIENNFLDEKALLIAPVPDLKTLTKERIGAYPNGVLGMDMSVFTKKIHTVLLNGICESYITSNEAGMLVDTDLLFEGLLLLMKNSGAEKGIITVRKNFESLLDVLTNTAKKYADHPIEIKAVEDILPMCQGHTPLDVGVLTVDTDMTIAFARFLKTGIPQYERIVTLSGEGFRKPQNVQVRIGTLLKDVVEAIGGYVEGLNPKHARLVAGGAFRGSSVITDDLSILSTTNAFLCLTDIEKEVLPCIHCGTCIDYCPVGIQPVQIAAAGKSHELLEKLGADRCVGCGHCSSVCPSFIELTSTTTKAKAFYLSKK
ncbi:MAG: 4Fe-4S dicluster domain-containing protein [Defluviitaleaceae bacterium]|nr:4Fe-4S dicluster domain-containing protein [Defluviitaleaceae bacterium]